MVILDEALSLECYLDSFSAYKKLSIMPVKHSNVQIMDHALKKENS